MNQKSDKQETGPVGLTAYEPSERATKWFNQNFGGRGIADPWPRQLMFAYDAGWREGFKWHL